METNSERVLIGNTPYHPHTGETDGKIVDLQGQSFYCIEHYDQLPPFFISLVSPSNHWMFISSTGGLTAGRINANSALFPYVTDDKVTENFDHTGSKTLLRVTTADKTYLWEPFSNRYQGLYQTQRNLYKNLLGTHLIFEEINHDLGLTFRYSWRTTEEFGFVKTSTLENHEGKTVSVRALDGAQYILPYGITNQTQSIFSNLLDAYKRTELDVASGIGMYTLSSTLSDMAEPNESLRATTVWYEGPQPQSVLLSSQQLDAFRDGAQLITETDLRGKRGAYFVENLLELKPGQAAQWHIILEVNQEITDVIALKEARLNHPAGLWQKVEADLQAGDQQLRKLVASADGLQCTGNTLANTHHFANTLFNIMRGGIFDDNYTVHRADFDAFLDIHHKRLKEEQSAALNTLPEHFTIRKLIHVGEQSGSNDLLRLCYEYLPLIFSRRHGDPSRPWNQFSINLKNPDGSRKLDFQGNWRDIFQNWEPLAISYPEFIESMIFKFLNATTGDGYNPYRLTFSGFEWEIPNPDDPWGNIGYWGDHQIIYLQKLLELSEQFHPGTLIGMLPRRNLVHANVPFRIRPFKEILKDWHNTIDFDRALHNEIEAQVKALGADAKLYPAKDGGVAYFSLAEKMLNLLLAKVINFVPDGGIWMNTQRPEWNDANNALAGKGLSVVTAAYLYRYVQSFKDLIQQSGESRFAFSKPLIELFRALEKNLTAHQPALSDGFSDSTRYAFMAAAGEAGTQYRAAVYQGALAHEQETMQTEELLAFLSSVADYLARTLRGNRRDDKLYHAYNVLKVSDHAAAVGHLDLMLEGQVAILSSGLLDAEETLALLDALRRSTLYRADQHSYTLYPDKDLKGFLVKNVIPTQLAHLKLFERLIADQDHRLVLQDIHGGYHFSGALHNERGLNEVLDELAAEPAYADLVQAERGEVLAVFEAVFNHSSFTGRSGTFFGYEGLGSIYWHMVTKLLLAVQENYWRFQPDLTDKDALEQINDYYYDVRDGIGFNKTPAVYGAFPTDPYSHTPKGAGAKQPGMTGQVKEELVARWRELGVLVEDGVIRFAPLQLQEEEFLGGETAFDYYDPDGLELTLTLPENSLAFTFCQVPVIYRREDAPHSVTIHFYDGESKVSAAPRIGPEESQLIFRRAGKIERIEVVFPLKVKESCDAKPSLQNRKQSMS
ncbi:MAG: hypothetical protein JW750_08025 [Anaerolineaceae bacterium]|nr:hypothetical protein [Anaerolineaceae bacterium]